MDNSTKTSISEKKPREKKISKKARLIVRNLSFQVTEDKFRKHFSKCGDIQEINILKKSNGKLLGCAFIQYARVPDAAKAIRELNLQPFMGRPIAIDWSLPKKTFQGDKNVSNNEEKSDSKEEISEIKNDEIVEIKEEPLEEEFEIKEEQDEVWPRVQKRELEDSEAESDDSKETIEHNSQKKRKIFNDDADEGRTLFLRNLEFEATQDKVKEFFETFGPLCYAVLCKDRLTEHPKGTAFVKFKCAVDLDSCMSKYESDPSHFLIGQRQVVIAKAMSKNKLDQKLQFDVKKEPKDSRNLFLAREGFIRPDTDAMVGVSLNDINKRTALHRAKKQMLKDLNIFVSDVRICIHNLPPEFTDKNLRKLFIRFGGKGTHLTEAKVMRDMTDMDINGVGKSKEFGFVTFTKHENALQALRAINNNPTVFTPKRRPIVEFSLENRRAIQAKENRAAKSRELNKNINKTGTSESEAVPLEGKQKKGKRSSVGLKVSEPGVKKLHKKGEEELPKYSGLTAKFGISTLPSLKAKGKITRKSLKPVKNHKKNNRQERRMREPKSRPQFKRVREDQVDKLVSGYKKKEMGEFKHQKAKLPKQKKKWFN